VINTLKHLKAPVLRYLAMSASLGRCADDQITVMSQVKRCDEMARKIRYFHEQVSSMLNHTCFCSLQVQGSSVTAQQQT
jgi:hypothetical protein